MPNLKQRKQVLAHYIQNIKPEMFSQELASSFEKLYLDLATKTRGLSQRDIEKLISNLIHQFVDRIFYDDKAKLVHQDFVDALQKFKPKSKLVIT